MRYEEIKIGDLPKLHRDINQAVFWQEYVNFARRFFDDTVVKLECETYGEYNDEGGTDYSVSEVTAYDYNGEEVALDGARIRQYIEDDMDDYFSEEKGNLPIADESEYSFVVDLTQEPTRPRIALIIEE